MQFKFYTQYIKMYSSLLGNCIILIKMMCFTFCIKLACGLYFIYGNVSSVGAKRGEWITMSVELHQDKQNLDRNYLYVIT